MTHVFERLYLTCPYARARDFLRDALEPAALGQRRHTVPLGASRAEALDKNVVVRYERGRDPMHFDEPWRVFWTPEDGGPYPDFSGELTVRADETYRGSVLELHGDYAPPLGAVGRAFDMVLGAKIATATARTLLAQIGAQLQARFENEEAKI